MARQRTTEAIAERTRRARSMSAEDRHKLGLRLFAIYSGQQSAKAYKARGLDSFVHARAAQAKQRAARKLAQTQGNEEDRPRSKTLPIA